MDKTAIVIAILGSGGVWAILNTVTAYIIRRLDEKHNKQGVSAEEFEAHGKALRGLLYGELERRCTGYIQSGNISAGELNDLRRYYYEPYKALHGDGTIDRLMTRVESLDIRDD